VVVVIGDGKWVVPVDFAVRRPDPVGAGGPCRDKLSWAREMIDARLLALSQRGLHLPPPIITADSWFSDSKLMGHVRRRHQGTLLVEGKVTYTFTLTDGRHVHGHDFVEGEWPWRTHPWAPGVSYVRLQATSPTYGAVTVVIVGIHTNRDKLSSIAYSEELISCTISATLQSTDQHHGIVGQKCCHYQLDS